MLAEIGLSGLALAFCAAIYAIIASVYGARKHSERIVVSARNAALLTTMAALIESCVILRDDFQRVRLRRVILRSGVQVYPLQETAEVWNDIFDWMHKYADHQPDWTDALYAVLSGRDSSLRIWTYDSEFRTIWRRRDGSQIPLAVRN